nr:FMN-binding negative transcriptional regulator [Shewanella sp. 10N.286.52.B9]
MYLPKKSQMQSNEALDFIQQFGFALLSSSDLQASHLPLILKTDADGIFWASWVYFT